MPSLSAFVGHCVVLDTASPLVYIGHLAALDDRGYWLREADVHDRDEGHSTKEKYVNDASLLEADGLRPKNRRQVFVERTAVVSISLLADVLAEGAESDNLRWPT
ncbi:MAG: hypothetical protein IPM18_15415 [Phycisphaerales bacterium]|nr:hypothetical protein [Phycisphaerales bacterium]